MEWKGHKSYNTSCYIYKNIMLKKTGKLLLCQKNQENFQASNIVAKSDRGKFYRTYPAYISFSPLSPIREKLFMTIYGFIIFRPSF